jgi:putative transposase
MRRAGARIRKRVQNLVRDLHCKLAKFLCERYHVVLIPEFETQGMIRRGQRRIGSKTARALATWSHYSFRRRLLDKAREYPWCKVVVVVVVNEAYTSKTCGRCGELHHTLGGSKVFRCPRCSLQSDRDLHAARNIMLRFLTTATTTTTTAQSELSSEGLALRPTSCPTSEWGCISDPFVATEDKCGVFM